MGTEVPLLRFGKPSGPLLQQKTAFFTDNDKLQANLARICGLYAQQPLRTNCKNCDGPLRGMRFEKLGVTYVQCERCGHLSGANEDTDQFCESVYTEGGGAAYAKVYSATDREAYEKRVSTIYQPKVQFLREVLAALGEDFHQLRHADLGAGSGYYVAALLKESAARAVGYEVSETQVQLARTMVDGGSFRQHALSDLEKIIREAEADVFSMIGVLEHVRYPREALAAIRANPNARFLYISVPMFSPSVYLESVSPEIFHRQLGAGHTHLYTDASLNWICKEFGFERVGEWWFGTDVVDLFRHVGVKLERRPETQELARSWYASFADSIDAMQLALDRRKQSSEVHMVLRRTG